MGLFSRARRIRTTHEAETLRAVFRENQEHYERMAHSPEYSRYRKLKDYVTSNLFVTRRKETEALVYKNSKEYRAEKRYKELLTSKKLRAFYQIRESKELAGYLQITQSATYVEFRKLKVVVNSPGFDKHLHITELQGYKKLLKDPKIKAALKFEKNRKYRFYCEIKDTEEPKEFEKLSDYVKTDEFKSARAFLLNKKRYTTTDDYKILCEFEALEKHPDLVKFFALHQDPHFRDLQRWDIVFEDDFNTGRLDTNTWITRYYAGERFLNDTYGVGKDCQLYLADNVTLDGSSVALHFKKESIIGKYWDETLGIREKSYDYTSGLISTAISFRQQYGKFEAKIRLSRSSIMQHFWMKSDTNSPQVEIMRCNADGIWMGESKIGHSGITTTLETVADVRVTNDYFIFTLDWQCDRLVWSINDTVVKVQQENIPNIPMYLLFSLGTTQVPSDRSVPTKLEIDWVRCYRKKE